MVCVLAACSSGPAHEKKISRTDLGDQWPLTVDSGTIACRDGSSVVFTADGTTYAVNGTAKGENKYPEIDQIWAADPSVSGLKKDISALLDAGLALC